MKTLVKTGKVIKVNPLEILDLYKFAKYNMRWKPEDFIKNLSEIYPYRQSEYVGKIKFLDENNVSMGAVINIPISFVILPSVMHIEVPRFYRDIIKTKRLNKISIDDISYFNVYQVVNSFTEGKFDEANLSILIALHRIDKNYAIRSMWLEFRDKYLSRSYKQPFIEATVFDTFPDEDTVKRYIDFVRKVQGVSYSELSQEVRNGIKWIEEDLTLTLNLFHTLYSYNFEGNDVVGLLFKEYSDLVKSFGCKFDDALSSLAQIISAFMF
jgi:hypothetical protein